MSKKENNINKNGFLKKRSSLINSPVNNRISLMAWDHSLVKMSEAQTQPMDL